MLKKLLYLSIISASGVMSAGLWQALSDDAEKAALIATYSQEDQEKLQAACDESDKWQRESQEAILAIASANSEGFALLQRVVGAAEIRVHSELIFISPETRSLNEEEEIRSQEAEEADKAADVSAELAEEAHA